MTSASKIDQNESLCVFSCFDYSMRNVLENIHQDGDQSFIQKIVAGERSLDFHSNV